MRLKDKEKEKDKQRKIDIKRTRKLRVKDKQKERDKERKLHIKSMSIKVGKELNHNTNLLLSLIFPLAFLRCCWVLDANLPFFSLLSVRALLFCFNFSLTILVFSGSTFTICNQNHVDEGKPSQIQ